MNFEQIELELANMKSWNEGERLSDEQYVRNFLISNRDSKATQQWYEQNNPVVDEDSEMDDEDFVELSDEEWQGTHEKSVAEVDAMTPEARLTEARKVEADREREYEEFISRIESGDYEEIAAGPAFGEMFSVFFATMFGFFDVLFVAFALSTAYKVALGTDD